MGLQSSSSLSCAGPGGTNLGIHGLVSSTVGHGDGLRLLWMLARGDVGNGDPVIEGSQSALFLKYDPEPDAAESPAALVKNTGSWVPS